MCCLDMRGPPDVIRTILEVVDNEESAFDLEKILPTPAPLRDTEKSHASKPGRMTPEQRRLQRRFGSTNWYDWRVANWGTKWNVSGEEAGETWRIVRRTRNLVTVRGIFDTAWSPPEPCVAALSERFPEVRFEIAFKEEGMGFAGRRVIRGGSVRLAVDGRKVNRTIDARWRTSREKGLDFWKTVL